MALYLHFKEWNTPTAQLLLLLTWLFIPLKIASHKERNLKPGAVACACDPSNLGIQGRRIPNTTPAWAT